jgi:hypothetical protein
MQDNNMLDRMRDASRRCVDQLDEVFLKPDPETFICQLLNATGERRHPLQSQRLPPALMDAFKRAVGDDQVKNAARLTSRALRDDAERLTRAPEPSPEFERVLSVMSCKVAEIVLRPGRSPCRLSQKEKADGDGTTESGVGVE